MIGPNCDINSTSKGNTIAPMRYNSLLYTSVGCLLCSMANIYDLWDGSLDKRASCVVWSLVRVRIAFELKYRNTQ